MAKNTDSSIKLLVLYDILLKSTDEEHALSTNEIIEELKKRGISVSRKVLPSDIDLLNKYGYEICSYVKKSRYYAFGFINEGLYSIISANNIVGEWAGMSVGLENCGEYAIVAGNKILATHTICGRTIRNYGSNTSIEDNVLTSTSRNARIIEQNSHNCIIGRNIMEVLMVQSECRSGCGI